MMLLLSLAFVVAAVVAIAALPPLHPAQIWALVWALAVGAYSLRLFPYLRLGTLAQVLIGCASLGFMSGALLGERHGGKALSHLEAPRAPHRNRMKDLPLAAIITLGVTLVGLVGFLLQAYRHYGLHAALVSSPDVRMAVHHGGFSLTVKYVYAAVAASVLCGACTAIGPHRRRWVIATGFAVLSTYFTTGRSTMVVATVSALCAYSLVRPSLPSKRAFVLGGCAVAIVAIGIFTIGGSLIGKTFDHSELATIESTFEQHPVLRSAALPYEYMSAPIAAFGLEVADANRLPQTTGCASFAYVCSVLRHAGLGAEPLPAVRRFTAAPLKWNTYTSLDAPLLDGGPWLVIPAAVLAGLLLGALWAAARRHRLLALVCYAALTPAIVTASGSDNFTAPLILGAMLLALGALLIAQQINLKAIRTQPCDKHDS